MTECKIESFEIFLTQLSLSDGFSQKCCTPINFTRIVLESSEVVDFSKRTRTRRGEIICSANLNLSTCEYGVPIHKPDNSLYFFLVNNFGTCHEL